MERKLTWLAALLILSMLGVGAVHAQTLYKWIDKDGKVSYQPYLPPEGSGYRVEEKNLSKIKDLGASTPDAADKAPVVLYVVPKCASCDLARAYLQKRKVPFAEKNAENDTKVQEELKKKAGALSVPTVIVGEKVMKGYLESLLEGELDQAGYPKIAEGDDKKADAEPK
jgi:glutaredoxin